MARDGARRKDLVVVVGGSCWKWFSTLEVVEEKQQTWSEGATGKNKLEGEKGSTHEQFNQELLFSLDDYMYLGAGVAIDRKKKHEFDFALSIKKDGCR